ncbi:evolutionarily conserved C-terminal region 2 [Striga asiatica]|uniref:Evolutionarily conserved C-terminal region 2 n=1 Tax=Striga asiatica TaxID=4170 RepID=A0A5A7NX23_STRAF|nr:evolutionarily conserved C-terminal region 2 [Striga asiatica]
MAKRRKNGLTFVPSPLVFTTTHRELLEISRESRSIIAENMERKNGNAKSVRRFMLFSLIGRLIPRHVGRESIDVNVEIFSPGRTASSPTAHSATRLPRKALVFPQPQTSRSRPKSLTTRSRPKTLSTTQPYSTSIIPKLPFRSLATAAAATRGTHRRNATAKTLITITIPSTSSNGKTPSTSSTTLTASTTTTTTQSSCRRPLVAAHHHRHRCRSRPPRSSRKRRRRWEALNRATWGPPWPT